MRTVDEDVSATTGTGQEQYSRVTACVEGRCFGVASATESENWMNESQRAFALYKRGEQPASHNNIIIGRDI